MFKTTWITPTSSLQLFANSFTNSLTTMSPPTPLTIINVPSNVGSMIRGKHNAPQAFREAGLADRLSTVGYDIREVDALPDGHKVWRLSDTEPSGVRLEAENVEVCQLVRDALDASLAANDEVFQLVVEESVVCYPRS